MPQVIFQDTILRSLQAGHAAENSSTTKSQKYLHRLKGYTWLITGLN